MAEWQTLARPYAKAAFDYAQEAGQLDQWSHALSVCTELTQQESFEAYIKRPGTSDLAIVDIYKDVLGDQSSSELVNFLKQLAEHERLELLPMIQSEYEELKAQVRDSLSAIVESAFAIGDAELKELEAALSRKFGSTVQAEVIIKPELIAGTRIMIADQVIDDSVASKLNDLRASLLA